MSTAKKKKKKKKENYLKRIKNIFKIIKVNILFWAAIREEKLN